MADVNEQQAARERNGLPTLPVPLQRCWPMLSTGKLRAIWATV